MHSTLSFPVATAANHEFAVVPRCKTWRGIISLPTRDGSAVHKLLVVLFLSPWAALDPTQTGWHPSSIINQSSINHQLSIIINHR
jgi:hypothetical protein